MKLLCISCVLTPMNTSERNRVLSSRSIRLSWGLNRIAACCNSAAHSPRLLRMASSAGTQPSGPVPVTKTLRAPSSYNFCNYTLSTLNHSAYK